MPTYSVIRYYKDGHKSKVIATDLTREEAEEHCRDSDTSSRTATSKEAQDHTKQYGQWFDGYIED